MDVDTWSLVLVHLSFSDLCLARGTEKAAREAHVPMRDLIIRRRTTDKGSSFALAVRQHVLTHHSRLLTLVLHHLPLGGQGAMHLSRGHFDSLQVLDLTNCSISDAGASELIWKTKDVPILVLDRNPLREMAFHALMHKYFHLSSVAGEQFVVAVRNMPEMDLDWIRMLTWGLLQVTTSQVEAHCTPLNNEGRLLFQQACAPNRVLFAERKSCLKPVLLDIFSIFQRLPICTNLRIRIPVPPAPLAADSAPLAADSAPLAADSAPLAADSPPLAADSPPLAADLAALAPLVVHSSALALPKDRNARRKLPLPHDTTCHACGHVWRKDTVTISQCETFRSQCKVHNRPCATRM